MSVLLDTNILLRMAELQHGMHETALQAAKSVVRSGETVCLVSQNLYEFWVVSTRPVAQNGLGLTSLQADSELRSLKGQFQIHDDTPAIRAAWEQLVVKHQVVGKNAHDARLVAARIVHKIGRILTFNTPDFARYQEIVALAPQDVIKSAAPK